MVSVSLPGSMAGPMGDSCRTAYKPLTMFCISTIDNDNAGYKMGYISKTACQKNFKIFVEVICHKYFYLCKKVKNLIFEIFHQILKF